MAAVIVTALHRRAEETPRTAAARRLGIERTSPAIVTPVLSIQRVFRGFRVRKQRRKYGYAIDPEFMLNALDRHARERIGFAKLCWFCLYLALFVAVAASRAHGEERFHVESALATVINSMSAPSGVTWATIDSPTDVYVRGGGVGDSS